MKKLVFAAAVVAAAFGLKAELASANVVGYQDITIPGKADGSSYSLFTVTFKNVSGEGEFKINSIKVCNAAGVEFDGVRDKDAGIDRRSQDNVVLMKLNPNTAVVYDEQYAFTTRGGLGWHLSTDTVNSLADSITLKNGEGVYVSNSQGEDIKLRISGEVAITPVSYAIPHVAGGSGYAVCGNFTPSPIQINKIKVLNSDKVEFDGVRDKNAGIDRRSQDNIVLMKLNPDTAVVYDEQYSFTTRGGLGWHLSTDTSNTLPDSYVLNPGEGVYVSNSQGEPVYLQLPSPVSE